MPTPALATDALIDDLNRVRRAGRLLENEMRIARIKKDIEPYKSNRVAEYWLYLASLYCLMGNVEETIDAGAKGLKLTSDPDLRLHHVRTLINLGKFSLARDLISGIPDYYFLESDYSRCYCLFQAADFYRFSCLAKEHSKVGAMLPMIHLSDSVYKILERQDVRPNELLRMIDLAGDLLRDKGLISSRHVQIFSYPGDGTITVNLPVSAEPVQVADLDWEYAERLFTRLPNAPATIIHVGFSCAPEGRNG
jgi:hypothetical protein